MAPRPIIYRDRGDRSRSKGLAAMSAIVPSRTRQAFGNPVSFIYLVLAGDPNSASGLERQCRQSIARASWRR